MHMARGNHSPSRHVVRVAQADTSSSTQSGNTPVPSSGPPLPHLSTSARSLIGTFAVISAILFAIVAWRMRSLWKRSVPTRKVPTRPAHLSIVYNTSKKPAIVSLFDSCDVDEPSKAVLEPPMSRNPVVAWEKPVRSVKLPSGVSVPPVAVTAPSRSPKYQDEYPPTPHSGPALPSFPSPPPVYRLIGLQSVPIPPPPPNTAASPIPPPTPISRKFVEPTSTPLRRSFNLPPVPSPRSASFNTRTTVPQSRTAVTCTAFTPKTLPRLMLVSTSFKPTRDDELAVRAGEALRVLKEFEDEWCLVQRVGSADAEKGVVPRFCLVDRPRVTKGRPSLSVLTFNGARRK